MELLAVNVVATYFSRTGTDWGSPDADRGTSNGHIEKSMWTEE
jgi:hypothetical protein